MIKKIFLAGVLLLAGGLPFFAAVKAQNSVKIYPYLMNPRQHPDETRR